MKRRSIYLHLATHGFFASPKFQSALQRTLQDTRPVAMESVGNQTIAGSPTWS